MVLVDILKRYQTLKGRKALMLTGTDEHGMKVWDTQDYLGTRCWY